MLIGHKDIFAIESEVSSWHTETDFLDLGDFVYHINNHFYGVKEPDATGMGCSYDSIKTHLSKRGRHDPDFLKTYTANEIVEVYLDAYYLGEGVCESKYSLDPDNVVSLLFGNEVVLVPDGDEAFDDGSHILLFDKEEKVRVIAFNQDEWKENKESSINEMEI